MIIPKLVIISLGKQARLGCVIPCAPCWSLGLHKGGWGLEERPGYRRLLPLKELPTPPSHCRTLRLDTALPDKVVFPAYKGGIGLNPQPTHTPFFLPSKRAQ